jgi:hypothetical protein
MAKKKKKKQEKEKAKNRHTGTEAIRQRVSRPGD